MLSKQVSVWHGLTYPVVWMQPLHILKYSLSIPGHLQIAFCMDTSRELLGSDWYTDDVYFSPLWLMVKCIQLSCTCWSLWGHSVIGCKNSWTSARINAPNDVYGLFSAYQPFHYLQRYSGNTQNLFKPPSLYSLQTVKGWSKSCSCMTSLLQIWLSNM